MPCRYLKHITIAIVATMAFASVSVMLAEESEADAWIALTDGRGMTFELSEPAKHIATLGKGLTLTAIDLGFVDSIVVCDKYSVDRSNEKFSHLVSNVDNKKTTADGSIYSSGYEQFCVELFDAADKDKRNVFDRDKDVVMLTVGAKDSSASGKNALAIEDKLKANGFKNVLIWFEITEYSEVVKLVEQVSLALTGSSGELSKQMAHTSSYITDKLGERERAKAFYVTYSSSQIMVGNHGSLATSMLLAAGAEVVTLNESKPGTTYYTDIATLVEDHGFNLTVFADNTLVKNTDQLNILQTQVGDKVRIVPLDPLWNNFDPESQEGLWAMACALYPDLFDGSVPELPKDKGDNTLLYVSAAIATMAIIGVVAFVFMKGKH